ncbi:LTA synthase family protein [Pseudothauera nasutitermitis]|uniref:LTA synthase family protein n=1 Tax=Pseudothauera nasutitermitis TaxID=2565930 RepID=A0A4S4ATH5_9RHOO|nr:LTA synthase family protein [Pseudothauera nasutitermitis]THF63040.1 LTA synthase family protein [Pseudothauera nasutitermitis]
MPPAVIVAAPAQSSARQDPPPSLLQRFWAALRPFGPYAPLVAMMVAGLLVLSASRIGLMLWQWERVAATGIAGRMLLQGVRVDLIQVGLLVVPPLLLAPVLATAPGWRLWRRLTWAWAIFGLTLLVFLELATPGFIGEYDTRPNRLFVEYLKYPNEVLSMLWLGFRVHLLAGLVFTAVAAWAFTSLMRPWLGEARRGRHWQLWLSWPFVFLLAAFAIRSTTDHRPANPALFALTTDTMVNSLILNSTWSVTHAIYNLKHESGSSEIYGRMGEDEILDTVFAARGLQRPPAGSPLPTLTLLEPTRPRERPLNLVIVLEESLGATFVESLGGLPVTPELEKLKEQGWWFEQLYATGTRSVRGIEAVTAGFLPTPAQSVVKLSLSQENFFSLAEPLRRRGYLTEFIYGGESHFDNMRSFFKGNGFTRIVDQNDYPAPRFKGSWGVSDEDLFDRAHAEISRHHAEGKPFFTLVFTSSNHAPFEFPDGRIELYDSDKATENNAVKYADHALGRFFEKARQSDYWRDTLFLVVADHDIRVRGDTAVPIERFHIPGLILGADIEARRLRTVASQVDLPVTLLSLMGIRTEHPMIGRDLSAEAADVPGRAMMQYEQNYAWMEGDRVVVLRPDQPPLFGRYERSGKRLVTGDAPPPDGEAFARRALAHSLLPAWLYRERLYRLPDEAEASAAAR